MAGGGARSDPCAPWWQIGTLLHDFMARTNLGDANRPVARMRLWRGVTLCKKYSSLDNPETQLFFRHGVIENQDTRLDATIILS